MIVRKGVKPLVFREESRTVEVRYDNRGEPYRDGVELTFDKNDHNSAPVWVLLEEHEVIQLRDKLNEYLGQVPPPTAAVAADPARFGQYDHLDSVNPVLGWLGLGYVCDVAVKANYGAVRLATALVRAIEARDAKEGRLRSTLGERLRCVIEGGAF